MKPNLIQFTLAVGLIFFGNIMSAQKYSNEFLNIGLGARAQGMSNAITCVTNDAMSAYWNPAGLMDMGIDKGVQIGAMHNEWFAGIGKYDYLGIAVPISGGKRALAISGIRFGIDNIPNTLSLYQSDGTINYDNVVEFSAADYAFLASYAQKIGKENSKLSMGMNMKVVYRQIGSFANSWGFGLDAGLQYHSGPLRLSLMVRDVTSTFNAWAFNFKANEKEQLKLTNNEIPLNSLEYTLPQVVLGFGYYKEIAKFGILGTMDWVATTDGKRNVLVSAKPISLAPSFGAELNYNKLVYLRGGIGRFQQQTELNGQKSWLATPSFGVGLQLKAVKIDYAYSDMGDSRNKAYSHVISLIVHLKPKKTSKFG
jgi:hypothetical protein